MAHLSRKTRAGALLVVLALAATLALGGCAGPSSAPARPSIPAGAARLIATADQVCKRLNLALAATPPHKGQSNLAIARNAIAHAALERHALAELAELKPPASLIADWAQILAYRRKLATELITLGHYWSTNDKQALSTLAASKKQTHQKLATIATHDGFKDCANVGTTT